MPGGRTPPPAALGTAVRLSGRHERAGGGPPHPVSRHLPLELSPDVVCGLPPRVRPRTPSPARRQLLPGELHLRHPRRHRPHPAAGVRPRPRPLQALAAPPLRGLLARNLRADSRRLHLFPSHERHDGCHAALRPRTPAGRPEGSRRACHHHRPYPQRPEPLRHRSDRDPLPLPRRAAHPSRTPAPDELRNPRPPARRLSLTAGRPLLQPPARRVHHRRPEAPHRADYPRSRDPRPRFLHRCDRLLRRTPPGQRRAHPFPGTAVRRHEAVQERGRHHLPQRSPKRIRRNETESLCASLLKPSALKTARCGMPRCTTAA